MTKTHIDAANEADNRGLTLREATQHFLSGALPEEVLANAETDDEAARMTLKMMRAFQEGAFWACWLFHREFYQDKPDTFKLMCEILEEHANVRDISEGKKKNRLN